MYEQGCTCDLTKLDYNDGKLVIPGQNGFLYLCQDVEGKCDFRENENYTSVREIYGIYRWKASIGL